MTSPSAEVPDPGRQMSAAFEVERPRLLRIAYRMTGSVADAEDAVQEAWLRLDRQSAPVENLQAWLTRVVSRLCLDRLGSAVRRRETYVGQWLPEPIVRPIDARPAPDPLDVVVQGDEARLGALVVLDTLTPAQRVAFVLHDVFDVPFTEIADILGVGSGAARQHASRARRAMADAPEPVDDGEHAEAVGRFLAAMASGDLDAIVATLHPAAYMIGDAGGAASTAINVVRGPERFARFYLGLLARYGEEAFQTMQPVLVNGQLGLYTPGWDDLGRRPGSPPRIAGFTVRDGLVLATYDVVNPDKLTGVRL